MIAGPRRSPGEENHSSILVWRIPWTEETGGLWSVVSQRVTHDWGDLGNTQASNDALTVSGGQQRDSAVCTCTHSPPSSPPIQADTWH